MEAVADIGSCPPLLLVRILTIASLASIAVPAFAAELVLGGAGGWSEVIDASDLEAGAGSELISTHDSLVEQVTIDIHATGGVPWEVRMRLSDLSSPAPLRLWARRTSDGASCG